MNSLTTYFNGSGNSIHSTIKVNTESESCPLCSPPTWVLNQIPYDYTVEVRNRFKKLDLRDRVPDELWMEVHDIVQETGIKTIPKKKKCKKAKWLSEEALQNSCEKQRRKGKIKASECRVPKNSKER